MEGAVYILCAMTALACGVLLLRGYRRTRVRLLAWCGLFFLALMLENIVLFVDLVIVLSVDLSAIRHSAALIGTTILLYGLIWEVKH